MTLLGRLSVTGLRARLAYVEGRIPTFSRGSEPRDAYRAERTRLLALIAEIESRREPRWVNGSIYGEALGTEAGGPEYDSRHSFDNQAPSVPPEGDTITSSATVGQWVTSNGSLAKADSADTLAVGVVLESGGGEVSLGTGGSIETSLPTGPVYLSTVAGSATSTPPTSGFVQRVGTVSGGRLYIEVEVGTGL